VEWAAERELICKRSDFARYSEPTWLEARDRLLASLVGDCS